MLKLTTSEKIKLLLTRRDMTVTDLAEKIGQSRQNITNKLKRNNFSEADLSLIASALDCKFSSTFIMKDTGETL